MGTNYYIENNKCCECGRSEKFHIGKNSWGWEFNFKAWAACEFREITSWETWKKVISGYDSVVDENGKNIPIDLFIEIVEDSREMIQSLDGSARHPINHYDYCVINHPDIVDSRMWKDSDGWTFSHVEFS